MARPNTNIDWTVGNPDPGSVRIEPGSEVKQEGYAAGQPPPHQNFNWILFNIDAWIKELALELDALNALQSTYDVVIGAGGTHATLADAIADGDLGDDLSVLIKDPHTVTSTIVLSKNGWIIDFKAQAFYAQGLNNTPGLQITGNRNRIRGGRFIDFDSGSAVAIRVEAGAANNSILGTYFNNCDQEVSDAGDNTTIKDTVTEV